MSAFYYNIPSVRVEINDMSLQLPLADTGRAVFAVILTPQGPHNRVVEINSMPQFQRIFGKPDLRKTSEICYSVYSALRYTSRIFVIRAALLDSDIESENATLANVTVKYNSPDGSEEMLMGKFVFTNELESMSEFDDNTFASKLVFTNKTGFDQFKVGDYIFSSKDDSTKSQKIVGKAPIDIENDRYYLRLENEYQGTSDVDEDNENASLVVFTNKIEDNNYDDPQNYNFLITNKFVQNYAYIYFKGAETVVGTYTFTNNIHIAIANDLASFNVIKEEDWIYPVGVSSDFSRQIIKKQVNEITGVYELVLDEKYKGPTTPTPVAIKDFTPFQLLTTPNLKHEDQLDVRDYDNSFYFTALGVGSYYNSLYLKGVRNIEYENLYMTEDDINPQPIYKYAFLDLMLFKRNDDGTSTMLENYGTVSILNRVNGDEALPVLNQITGREMYLPVVINEMSQFIRCHDSDGAGNYLSGKTPEDEKRRLQFMSLFVDGVIGDSSVRGKEGFFLESGRDGIQYNSAGRINVHHGKIQGCVLRAYNGTLTSADKGSSIQKIVQEIYPKYVFDYVLSGGYSADIQKAASDLTWSRGSMLLLADTGGYRLNANEDLAARRTQCNWNNWSAALYTQYRKIFSPFEGKRIWVSPVYHAIEKHLKSDRDYWIAEPVAGVLKGIIEEPHELAYEPTHLDLERMIAEGLNPTIVDESRNGGNYFIAQQTTWKRFSKLKNQHVVKFLHFVKQNIPPLLKDILFQKATPYWVNMVRKRITSFLSPYTVEDGKYAAITAFDVSVIFDETYNTIYANISMRPIGFIQNIIVPITVT
jgi:hypothetical protein